MKVLVAVGQLGTDHTSADFMPGGTLVTLRCRRAVQSRFQSLRGLHVMVKVRPNDGRAKDNHWTGTHDERGDGGEDDGARARLPRTKSTKL